MVLKRFYNDKLAQASYMIGCPAAGEAMIIDANRDLQQYVAAAAAEDMLISAVTETHIHADYLSGSLELSIITGAKLYLSDEGTPDWKYEFASPYGVTLLKHGDSIRVGSVRVEVLKTPGHTPEHIAFLIYDEANSSQPMALLSGDFIFVGDVGRPDLLETAAGFQGTMEAGAKQLFHSLQTVAGLPEHVLVWPGHGAGSACGKALGAIPVSSLGYERMTNWGLRAATEESFVREVLSGQPEPPLYFAQMKKMNREGPPRLGGFKVPPRRLDGRRILDLIAKGVSVVDVREPDAYMARHIPGTLHIPMYRSFITWAGSVLPYDTDIVLIAPSESETAQAVEDLAMIGLDRVVGWYGEDVLQEFERPGPSTEKMEQITAADLLRDPSRYRVLDVRNRTEWDEGHVPDAVHIPLATLAKRAGELSKTETWAVHCAGGYRSPVAVSLLKSLGFEHVVNISDGYDGYAARLPAASEA